MKTAKQSPSTSVENIFRLEGRVPVAKAIPFGLQLIEALKGKDEAERIKKQIVIR